LKLLWQPLDVDQEWSNVIKGENMMFDLLCWMWSHIENRFWVKLTWSCFCVMGESILRFQCWIFCFYPSLYSIVHQVNACVSVFSHRLFYVVLIVLLLFLYLYIFTVISTTTCYFYTVILLQKCYIWCCFSILSGYSVNILLGVVGS